MKMITRILLLTALLAQQTALFATTAHMEAVKSRAIEATEMAEAGVWAAFEMDQAQSLFAFSSDFYCTKTGGHDLQLTETVNAGGSSAALRDFKTGNPTLTAFPNPSKGLVKISLSQGGADVYKIRISNTIGKVVRTIEPAELQAAGSNGVEVDLTSLPAGIYFYSLLVNEKMVETKRLIIQN